LTIDPLIAKTVQQAEPTPPSALKKLTGDARDAYQWPDCAHGSDTGILEKLGKDFRRQETGGREVIVGRQVDRAQKDGKESCRKDVGREENPGGRKEITGVTVRADPYFTGSAVLSMPREAAA